MTEERIAYRTMSDYVEDLTVLAGVTRELVEAHEHLRASVDQAMERLGDLVEDLHVSLICADLDTLSEDIQVTQMRLAGELVDQAADRAELAELERNLTLDWKQSTEQDLTDPTTGRKNKDYTDLLLTDFLAHHGPYVDLQNQIAIRQWHIDAMRADLEGLQARFSAARHRARLTSSMLVFLSEPARSLGAMQSLAGREA
jgi:hypothetical protein